MRNFLKTDHPTTDDEMRPDETGDSAMSSRDTTAPDSGERPAHTGLADENASAAASAADPDSDIDDDKPRPTFTPTFAASSNGEPATRVGSNVGSDPADDDGHFTRAMPAATSAADDPVTTLPADEPVAAVPMDEPVAAIRADEPVAVPNAPAAPAAPAAGDEPLFANAELMRASWQQVQAGFVDDPKAAVSDAADLIDVAVKAMVETLRQRQRQLRDMSGNGTANGVGNSAGYGSAASSDVPDTEQLRLVMQRYRSLFNQLVRS